MDVDMDTPRFTEDNTLSFTLLLTSRTRARQKLPEHAKGSNASVEDTLQFLYAVPPFITAYFQTVQILCADMTRLLLCSSCALTRRSKTEFSLQELLPNCCIFFSEALSRSREQLSVRVSMN